MEYIAAFKVGTPTISNWTVDSSGTLSVGLQAYWKMDETTGNRLSQIGAQTLTNSVSVLSQVGVVNSAALLVEANSQTLYRVSNSTLTTGNINFSLAGWVYFASTGTKIVASKRGNAAGNFEYQLLLLGNVLALSVSSDGNGFFTVSNSSFGALNTATFYNFVAWHSNNSHVGVSVNLSATTAPYTGGVRAGSAPFVVAATDTGTSANFLWLDGRVDELGWWKKVLSPIERQSLYNGGNGNTYTA